LTLNSRDDRRFPFQLDLMGNASVRPWQRLIAPASPLSRLLIEFGMLIEDANEHSNAASIVIPDSVSAAARDETAAG